MGIQPDPENYTHWPTARRQEIIENWTDRTVGSRIVSETETMRIWHLQLEPGERAPFHRHDEPYFWTVFGAGKSQSYYDDGSIKDAEYLAGDTLHFDFREGGFMVHDLENTGDTVLKFVTVEFKN